MCGMITQLYVLYVNIDSEQLGGDSHEALPAEYHCLAPEGWVSKRREEINYTVVE